MNQVVSTLGGLGSLPRSELLVLVSFGLLAWVLLFVGLPMVAFVLSTFVTATGLAAAQEVAAE